MAEDREPPLPEQYLPVKEEESERSWWVWGLIIGLILIFSILYFWIR